MTLTDMQEYATNAFGHGLEFIEETEQSFAIGVRQATLEECSNFFMYMFGRRCAHSSQISFEGTNDRELVVLVVNK